MNNALTKLEFNGLPVRIELINDEPWFVAKDVCDVLGLGNIAMALSRLDRDEVDALNTNDSIGRSQKMAVVSESGMYNLIFTSRKAEAIQFKRWVTHEVLPSLRKTGRFETIPSQPTTSSLAVMPRNALAAAKQLLIVAEDHETRLHSLEQRQEELEARPSLGSPPEGVLFPKFKPDHMTVQKYSRELGIKTKRGQTQSMGNRISRYCDRVGIFYLKTTHGNRYPIPVLQEFFK